MALIIKKDKGTILTIEGKTLFFGLEDYMNKIANGDCCFICGAEPNSKEFNDEHIIPDWILKKFDLHSKFISLPNDTKFKYSQYKVPCCKECNSELGKVYEEPISKLLSKPYSEIVELIEQDPNIAQFIFKWLCLIFLKTHLKDKFLLLDRDIRKNSGFIDKDYYWEEMHHIHCISRSHYTGAQIDNNVYGTIFILPSILGEKTEDFDYIDSQTGKGVLLQLGAFSIIAVLNDCCAGLTLFTEQFEKITGAVNSLQLREILAHLNFINLSIEERPVFSSNISYTGEYKIVAKIPETLNLIAEEKRLVTPGNFLRYYVRELIGDVENKEKILDEIEQNQRGFLFNEKGEFMKNN